MSCLKKENDLLNQNCDNSCATINGHVLTGDGSKPLSGASIEVFWESLDIKGGINRLKARSETNEDGYYETTFKLREDELENGFHTVQIMVPDRYLRDCFDRGYYEYTVSNLTTDSTVTTNFGIPLKATLLVSAQGVSNMGENDKFSAEVRSPFGRDFGSECRSGNLISWSNKTPEKTFTLDVAAEQPVIIQVNSTQDGQRTSKIDTLYFDTGENAEFTALFQ